MTPFVVAACPIRNREWAVEPFLEALEAQERRPDAVLFVTGDNEDGTERELIGRCADGHPFPRVIDHFDTGCPGWHRSGEPRYSVNDHAALADVYNRCIDTALERWPEATHVWMIDSDINPEPDVLRLLLEADKDIISAVVRNSPGAWNFMVAETEGEPRRHTHLERSHLIGDEPFGVTFLSACTLFRREVLERDAPYYLECTCGHPRPRECSCGRYWAAPRYAPDPRSHDFPLVAAAKAAGYSLWIEPRARTRHFYHGPDKEGLR